SVTGGGSLSAKIQEASTVGGSYSDISGGAMTALTASSKVTTIEVRDDQLTAGKEFVRCLLTETGSQNVVCACLPLCGEADYKPGKSQDAAAVSQRLVV